MHCLLFSVVRHLRHPSSPLNDYPVSILRLLTFIVIVNQLKFAGLREVRQTEAGERDARKYYESLHFLFECHWYELTSAYCPNRVEPGLNLLLFSINVTVNCSA